MTLATETPDAKIKDMLKKINKTLRQFFDVRRQRAQLKLDYDTKSAKLTRKYEKADAPLETLEDELRIKLRALIIPNRLLLLTGTRKSFATHFGKVYFSWKSVSYKVSDKKGFEKRARKERLLNKLGRFERVWKPNATIIDKWLQSDEEAAKRFAEFVERSGGFDELSVQPNEPYLTDHDPDRLTAAKEKIGAVPDVQDESPDA